MTTVYDVPAQQLIETVAADIEKQAEFKAPDWAKYVKTGVAKERAPKDPKWFHKRVASVFRRIYIDGPVGVQRLRTVYGGRLERGVRPSVQRKGAGKNLRLSLQMLEKNKWVKQDGKKGRVVTAQGQKYLDAVARKVRTAAIKTNPGLAKY